MIPIGMENYLCEYLLLIHGVGVLYLDILHGSRCKALLFIEEDLCLCIRWSVSFKP